MSDNRLIYKPQKEENDLIITATQKCNIGKCDFCSIHKKSVNHLETIEQVNRNIERAKAEGVKAGSIYIFNDSKIFMDFNNLKNTLIKIRNYFPNLTGFSICSEPETILKLPDEELKKLRTLGINNMNIAIGTGSDRILQHFGKNLNQEDIIKIGKKIKEFEIKLSLCIISGIGGKDRWIEHALESAMVINEIDPDSVKLLAFSYEKGSFISKEISKGSFVRLSQKLTLLETKKLIQHIESTKCVFQTVKSQSYLGINGILPDDKKAILKYIDEQVEKI